MNRKKLILMLINIIGGSAVIGSYIWGFRTTPDASLILWGSVPVRIRLLYTVGMFLAAGGYFAFLNFILLRLKGRNHFAVLPIWIRGV